MNIKSSLALFISSWVLILLTLLTFFLLQNNLLVQYDIIIRNGRVYDGSGSQWVMSDIGIKDGRIKTMGYIDARVSYGRVIDAEGLIVCPGFVDAMDQSGTVLHDRAVGLAENKLKMGVTTAIGGENGIDSLDENGAMRYVDVEDFDEWFESLEGEISMNFATFYSTTQARVAVMGEVDGRPTPDQMEQMKDLVRKGLEKGCIGIASALLYPPSSFFTTEELIELSKVASEYNTYYASHIRDEGVHIMKAINEAIRIGEESGVAVEIFHLKSGHILTPINTTHDVIQAIENARERGVDISANFYPYTAGGTGLDATVPSFIFKDGLKAGMELMKDESTRILVQDLIETNYTDNWNLVAAVGGWENIIITKSNSVKYANYNGSCRDIGIELGKTPWDACWDLMVEASPNRVLFYGHFTTFETLKVIATTHFLSVGTDASAAAPNSEIVPHPRSYGTFPKIFRAFVREGLLTLPDAIRKMTSWPAMRYGVTDRGVLRENLWADVVIFNYTKIEDKATFENPSLYPVGIEYVLVNGVLVIENGEHNGNRPGKIIWGRGKNLSK